MANLSKKLLLDPKTVQKMKSRRYTKPNKALKRKNCANILINLDGILEITLEHFEKVTSYFFHFY